MCNNISQSENPEFTGVCSKCGAIHGQDEHPLDTFIKNKATSTTIEALAEKYLISLPEYKDQDFNIQLVFNTFIAAYNLRDEDSLHHLTDEELLSAMQDYSRKEQAGTVELIEAKIKELELIPLQSAMREFTDHAILEFMDIVKILKNGKED